MDQGRDLTGRVDSLSHDVYLLRGHVADLQEEVASLRSAYSTGGVREAGREGDGGGDGEGGHPQYWGDADLADWLFSEEGRTEEAALTGEEGRTEEVVEEGGRDEAPPTTEEVVDEGWREEVAPTAEEGRTEEVVEEVVEGGRGRRP